MLQVDKNLGVYLLCDGMGGTSGGDAAASLAAQATLDYLSQHASSIHQLRKENAPAEQLVELAQAAVEAANAAVYSHTQAHIELRGSGTTLALLLTAGNVGACAHVGDSQIHAFRGGRLLQLTKDHSLAQDLIDRGVLDKNQLSSFPFRHVLSRAVGLLPAVSVDTLLFEILPGDRFLIATDGVAGQLGHTFLQQALSQTELQNILNSVVALARQSGSSDNFSAILIEASAAEDERDTQMARLAEIVLKTDVLQQVSLFKQLAPRNILRLINASAVLDCSAGSNLVHQGDLEMSLYIILDGSFEVLIDGQIIATLHRGNHFGEMALLTSHPRTASVRAVASGRVLRIAAEEFTRFVQEHPQDGVQMLTSLARELSERLRQTNQLHLPPS